MEKKHRGGSSKPSSKRQAAKSLSGQVKARNRAVRKVVAT